MDLHRMRRLAGLAEARKEARPPIIAREGYIQFTTGNREDGSYEHAWRVEVWPPHYIEIHRNGALWGEGKLTYGKGPAATPSPYFKTLHMMIKPGRIKPSFRLSKGDVQRIIGELKDHNLLATKVTKLKATGTPRRPRGWKSAW